jgi:DNA (cytosine-5)-methyltransferase 1
MYAMPHAAISPALKARDSKGPSSDGDGDGDGDGAILVPMAYRTAGDGAVFEEGSRTAPLTTQTDPCANVISYTTKLHNTTSNNAGKIFEERTAALDANSPPPALLTAMAVRRLTPKECERLMGFPDGYTNIPHKGKPAADGNRYKALGNSWVVPNIRWIGKRMQAVQNIKTESQP